MKLRGGAGVLALLVICCAGVSGERTTTARHPDEREGTATVIHGAEVLRDRGTGGRHLWPLYSNADVRLNYFEVTGKSGTHFHPDADHRVYVLEGKLIVTVGTQTINATVGDFIVIPKGVRHSYGIEAKGERALLLTFDAPPYDPKKTVNLEPSSGTK
jgi:quercetin dioxygenase-like cupin family protein